ncbi:MAG TPA: hypothetical protein ACFYD3_02520 [Candidatus Hypogeohydataceae bacterium YC41]
MKKLLLCIALGFFLIGAREVLGDGCCQGMKDISLEAVLEDARTSLTLTDSQVNTLKAILEKHGIKSGAHVCPMTEKAAMGGCCGAKKEAKAEEKSSQ